MVQASPNLLASIQARKPRGNANLMAALQKKKEAPTLKESVPEKVYKQSEKVFEFANDQFLFFQEGQKHTDLVPKLESKVLTIPLAPCAYRMTDYTLAKQEPIALERCVYKINVFRCLSREMVVFNQRLSTLSEDALPKMRFMELISNCGVFQRVSELILKNLRQESLQVQVEGLDEFLQEIEKQNPSLQAARDEINNQQTVNFYPGLGELYSPGTKVLCHPEGLEGNPLACSVVQGWYASEPHPSSGPPKRRYVLVLEFCISVGPELCFVAASDVYPEFHDASRSQPVSELQHKVLDDADLFRRLQERGEFYASVATDNHYLEYHPDSFFPILQGWNSNAVRPLSKGGRVMVDVQRGILEGHLPLRGNDGTSDTVKEAIKLFQQGKRTGVAVPFRTAVLDGSDSCDRKNLWQAWPMLTGFSFTARVWGKLLLNLPRSPSSAKPETPRRPSSRRLGVEMAALGGEGSCGNCGYIQFQEQAFEQLVLPADKKELIRAVASSSSADAGEDDDDDDVGIDVVANKGAASIFLLSGPPGTGKTLTAEAIAELLRKPLYIVTAGDLGITASEVEKTLGSVLDLCQTWDALVLIDEADIFLEKRSSTEIQRNALVCVMLRLLEYYSGCLFLSSNRAASSIDAAIASRITVMLTYPDLDATGRAKIWTNLLSLVPVLPTDKEVTCSSKYRHEFSPQDLKTLATEFVTNGRQIKNSIVLARALARQRKSPLSLEVLRRAVKAVVGET